ncbi:MAG: DNA/RNA non-specific endonuclease [Clostridiales bacterium]|nr:DNA/RNA non-specific endonuclease [Clostridiales bacterium]
MAQTAGAAGRMITTESRLRVAHTSEQGRTRVPVQKWADDSADGKPKMLPVERAVSEKRLRDAKAMAQTRLQNAERILKEQQMLAEAGRFVRNPEDQQLRYGAASRPYEVPYELRDLEHASDAGFALKPEVEATRRFAARQMDANPALVSAMPELPKRKDFMTPVNPTNFEDIILPEEYRKGGTALEIQQRLREEGLNDLAETGTMRESVRAERYREQKQIVSSMTSAEIRTEHLAMLESDGKTMLSQEEQDWQELIQERYESEVLGGFRDMVSGIATEKALNQVDWDVQHDETYQKLRVKIHNEEALTLAEKEIYDQYMRKQWILQERRNELNEEKGKQRAKRIERSSPLSRLIQSGFLAVQKGIMGAIHDIEMSSLVVTSAAHYMPLTQAEEVAYQLNLERVNSKSWMGAKLLTLTTGVTEMAVAATVGKLTGSSFAGALVSAMGKTGSAYEYALTTGAEIESANMYAMLMGAVQFVTQYSFGGVDHMSEPSKKIGEKLGERLAEGLYHVVKNPVARVALNSIAAYGGKAVQEGLEEYLQAVLDPCLKKLILNEESDINLFSAEKVQAAVVGTLKAAVLNLPEVIGSIRRGTRQIRRQTPNTGDAPNTGDTPNAGDTPSAGDTPNTGDVPNAGDVPDAAKTADPTGQHDADLADSASAVQKLEDTGTLENNVSDSEITNSEVHTGRPVFEDGNVLTSERSSELVSGEFKGENQAKGNNDLDNLSDFDIIDTWENVAARDGSQLIHDENQPSKTRLKSDYVYQTGEFDYFYVTDSVGRISDGGTKNLQRTMRTSRLRHEWRTPGKLKGDDAGHLFGDAFGGSKEIDNVVSQFRHLNRSGYAKMEKQWMRALEKGKTIAVRFQLEYEGDSLRPSKFNVCYAIDGLIEKIQFENR